MVVLLLIGYDQFIKKIPIGGKKMAVIIDLEKCTGCGTCEEGCPVEAIKVENEKAVVDNETCVDCGTCIEECPEKAISEGT